MGTGSGYAGHLKAENVELLLLPPIFKFLPSISSKFVEKNKRKQRVKKKRREDD